MNRAHLAVALAVALAGVPLVQASHAGHTYAFEDTIVHALPVPYATSTAHDYTIDHVQAGTTLTLALTWEDDPATDMDLSVLGPEGVCTISAEEDPACFLGVVEGMDCGGDDDPALPTDNRIEETVVARQDGEHTISVRSKLAERFERVDYELTVTLDEAHGSLHGPSGSAYVHTAPHCAFLG